MWLIRGVYGFAMSIAVTPRKRNKLISLANILNLPGRHHDRIVPRNPHHHSDPGRHLDPMPRRLDSAVGSPRQKKRRKTASRRSLSNA